MKPFDILQYCMAAAFVISLAAMGAAGLLYTQQGDLSAGQTDAFLRMLYWGIYPLGFVALGAFLAHLIRFYTGRDA